MRTKKSLLAVLTLATVTGLMLAPSAALASPTPTAPHTPIIAKVTVQAPKAGEVPVHYTDTAGDEHVLRALSADEIAARGIRFSNEPVPTGPASMERSDLIKAVKRPAGTVSPQADECWEDYLRRGFENDALYSISDVNWCGDGSWVRYTNHNCWGGSSWPTYNYNGCSTNDSYGAGWNLFRTHTQWSLCLSYVPGTGVCGWNYTPWNDRDYLPNGGVQYWGQG